MCSRRATIQLGFGEPMKGAMPIFNSAHPTVIALIFVMPLLSGCETQSENNGPAANTQAVVAPEISLVRLIVEPENFEEREIYSFGYLSDTGAPYIYLTKDHAVASDFQSSLRLADIPNEGGLGATSCINKYVFVRGKVLKSPKEHYYGIGEIREVIDAASGQPCWRLTDRALE